MHRRFGRKLLPKSNLTPWSFSEPFGTLDVVQVPFSEIILMARHLNVPNIRNFINEASMRQVRDPATPAPVAVDERGRSNQTFLMEAAVRRGGSERRAAVRGRDIYAITASLVVEASERICAGRHEGVGARALGELFDATDFLLALSPEHLAVSVHRGSL
jgi:hypothetical protein